MERQNQAVLYAPKAPVLQSNKHERWGIPFACGMVSSANAVDGCTVYQAG
jgi:hypothetical protein